MKYKANDGTIYDLPDLGMWILKQSPIVRKQVEAGHIGIHACRSLWKWFGFIGPTPRSLTRINNAKE